MSQETMLAPPVNDRVDSEPSTQGFPAKKGAPFEHFVQFYENDAHLIKTVGKYFAEALEFGEGAIIIASSSHREGVENYLALTGIDVREAKESGQLILLDAAETLAAFVINGLPNEKLFRRVIGPTIVTAGEGRPGVKAFGEMVALLWAEGNQTAAIQLEGFWNRLGEELSFSLYCAYPISGFGSKDNPDGFTHVCRAHSCVIPTESHSHTQTALDERLRTIAALQPNQYFSRNIREDRRIEDATAHFAAIVESSEDAIISKDLSGRITSWNGAAEQLFGYSPEQIIGKSGTILIPQDRIDEEPEILKRICCGERISHYETMRQARDGRILDISLTLSPIKDSNGLVIGISKIARDITARKQGERDLEAARKELARVNEDLERRVQERTKALRQAIEQMEEFSYTVSHDLRAPLRAMKVYSQVLLEEFAGNLPPDARHYLNRIADNAGRLDKMVLDVLTFSRMSRDEIRSERVSLNKLVRDIVEHYPGMQAPHALIQIGELSDVIGHEPSLTQAISNLLTNAVKFVPPGTTPKVRVWTEQRDGQVRLWIEDNGIGVDPKYQPRLFTMFERIHPELKYEGTGVGLAIVRKATERIGGKVGMESDGKTGSKFWIEVRGV